MAARHWNRTERAHFACQSARAIGHKAILSDPCFTRISSVMSRVAIFPRLRLWTQALPEIPSSRAIQMSASQLAQFSRCFLSGNQEHLCCIDHRPLYSFEDLFAQDAHEWVSLLTWQQAEKGVVDARKQVNLVS